jgi:hypothetical protein
MTRPTVTRATELVYGRLPAYVQADDETDWSLLTWLACLLDPRSRAIDFLDAADPESSVSGTCELGNPQAIDRAYLPWLGWLAGIDVDRFADTDQRTAIEQATSTSQRGTMKSIERAIARELTGSKSVRIYWGGNAEPYVIYAFTITSETPDLSAAQAAGEQEKPCGCTLLVTDVAGSAYADIDAMVDDYADLAATFDDFAAVRTYEPP